ncbi:TPM domain-containing protein [Psychrobacter urativorans]|uniref:Methanol dehydrogenase n=1 Tax=Psychrobacter urativorans TaxID=45610 RepID=A0A0M3V967_9GAMM|nr:TPM domain-containing protein [Psychrobacter urativorans]ALF60107.1 methanol dehydrogenase [Psychrobacter urativorans]
MNNSKALISALLFTLSAFGATALNAAPNDIAVAADGTASNSAINGQNRSVEDLVALAKAGEGNEAINDAVLGNDAVSGAVLGNDALNPNVANTANNSAANTAAKPANLPPITSSAASVDADKLILNSPVVDQANLLSAAHKQRLTEQLQSIYRQGLAQAALVIVPTTNGLPIFDYSLKVADKWKLGSKDVDDGLLIVMAVNDRTIYILTGYGLEGVLPDAAVNRIIREDITPYFKQNDYAGGLSAGISSLETRLNADPEVLARADAQAAERSSAQQGSDDSPSSIVLFIMAMIFGQFITSIFGRVFGSVLTAGGFVAGSLALGGGFFMTIIMAIFIWLFLIARGGGGGRGGRGGGGGGMVFLPGLGGGSSGGGFGGGGFGGGGFGGGGGGFGGGGAGGSW